MKLLKAAVFLPLLCYRAEAMAHRGTVELSLMNSVGNRYGDEYYVNVTVGTPGQLQSVMIDTGSSTTIFLASDASFCANSSSCSHTFNSSGSSTFTTINHGALDARYADWSYLAGDFVTDAVQIGDLVVGNVQVGLAHDVQWSNSPHTGIMGLGYSSKEAISRKARKHDGVPSHPSFVETLVKAKVIASRLFSIYLNTLDLYGSILFGGIDTAKYDGSLTTLNCLSKTGVVDSWYLTLQEVTMRPYDGPNQTLLRSTKDKPLWTEPDTGTPGWRLPTSAYHKVIGYSGARSAEPEDWGADSGSFVRVCSDVARGIANTTHFQLKLSGNGTNTATLDFELADLFTPLTAPGGGATTDELGRPLCQLRIVEVPERQQYLVMSSSVMKAGYWVFDLDNGQISLGQARLGIDTSNVVAVQAGADGLGKVTENVIAEAQKVEVEGQMSVPDTWRLSTATSTVGRATGAQPYPTVTGITTDIDVFKRRSIETSAAVRISGYLFGAWKLVAVLATLSMLAQNGM